MGIIICIDNRSVADCETTDDAWKWLVDEHHLPKELFIKEFPDQTPAIDDLPFKFYWNGHKYMITKVANLKKLEDGEIPIKGKFVTRQTELRDE